MRAEITKKGLSSFYLMKKLTRYTNIRDLKASKSQLQPQQSDFNYESDLSGFFAFMKQHSTSSKLVKQSKASNKPNNGK